MFGVNLVNTGPPSLRYAAVSPKSSRSPREAQDPRCEEGYCCVFGEGRCWEVDDSGYASIPIYILHQSDEILMFLLSTVNLALAFARRGIRTGILDTDIFGPSIPTLLNLSGEPRLDDSAFYHLPCATHN